MEYSKKIGGFKINLHWTSRLGVYTPQIDGCNLYFISPFNRIANKDGELIFSVIEKLIQSGFKIEIKPEGNLWLEDFCYAIVLGE